MGIAWTIARKDLLLLVRDRLGLFWVLAFPLIYALFFGSIFGGGGDRKVAALKIGVEDRDLSTGSGRFLENLAKSKSVQLVSLPKEEAKDRVRKGSLLAYLVLEKGFGEPSALFAGKAKMELGVDPARQAEQGFLQGLIMESYFLGMTDQFTDPEFVKEQTAKAIAEIEADNQMPALEAGLLKAMLASIERFVSNADAKVVKQGQKFAGPRIEMTDVAFQSTGPTSPFEVTFPSAILWGILGCAAGFAVSLVTERIEGAYWRLQVAPISRSQILAGKGLACFASCMAVQSLLLAVGWAFFKVQVRQPVLLAFGMICTAACFVGLMMLVATIGKTQQAVAGAGWAMFLIMAMLGGGMVPLIAMPAWMLTASSVSPVKWGILALEGAIWRNYSFVEMLLPCGVLLAVGITGFSLGAAMLRKADV